MRGFFRSKWGEHDAWLCRRCAFDTLDVRKIQEHVAITHRFEPLFASCITPTRNRPQFLDQLVTCFLNQTYPAKELVIVADGDNLSGMIPQREDIHYVWSPRRLTIGMARNVAVSLSKGDIIIHFDDDDWQAPTRIEEQVKCLTTHDIRVCGTRRIWCGDPEAEYADGFVSNYPVGCTLAYWREAWQGANFEHISDSEDNTFVCQFDPKYVLDMDRPEMLRYRNTKFQKTERVKCY